MNPSKILIRLLAVLFLAMALSGCVIDNIHRDPVYHPWHSWHPYR